MADNDDHKLHVAMFPWLAFGHMIPYLELAKLIAQKGHHISFISTPRNIHRLPKLPPHLSPLVKFIHLSLPIVDNLPVHAEATSDLPIEKIPYLAEAYDGLEQAVGHVLESSKPDWIIYDFAPHWLPSLAAKLGISRACFFIVWASSICVLGSSSSAMIKGEDPRIEPQHFTVPPNWIPFPTNVAFRLHEAITLFRNYDINVSGASSLFRFGSAIAGCQVIALRSCMELDAQWLSLLGELHQKPVLPVGLMLPTVPPVSEDGGVDDDDDDDESWATIRTWLGQKQDKGCVTYVAFGSEASTLSQEQVTELALGLELSRLPFFWVLRQVNGGPFELPDGFEERTKGHGIVWRSWAPQLRILAHESVGGFLTHCGWSSVIEGLHFGRALIMLPVAADQGLIARVFEEKQVGIEIPRNEIDGSFTRNSVAESLRVVMVDKEGEIYRNNAKEMKTIFGNKEVQKQYIDNFVEYLGIHRPGRIS